MGILAKAQAITDADEISENVILAAAIDWAGLTDLWWVVDTAVAAATAGTLKFELVLATGANLATAIQVCCVEIAAITDLRVATAGNRIAGFNVGKQMKDLIGASGSDYPYIGMKNTLSTSTTISINAALSPTEPPTISHAQAVVSNVGVPGHCSAGS